MWIAGERTLLSPTHPDKPRARRSMPGERALGYGLSGQIVLVPELQPLAADAIWRVILDGGNVGYLVRRDEQDHASGAAEWLPLQLDDLANTQIAIFEEAITPAV